MVSLQLVWLIQMNCQCDTGRKQFLQ